MVKNAKKNFSPLAPGPDRAFIEKWPFLRGFWYDWAILSKFKSVSDYNIGIKLSINVLEYSWIKNIVSHN